ncbi:Ankyrin repeat protein 1 [Giardia duodenalis]|uniref:Ankyrin repeat protein 1 n=1 Tax=Giardia intestinalis (strain ATCC 50803 / WB clone C6) TaxID=184922 RepID=A8BB46_GIAIC|nr:Ankyrin repeat protein 1 [Giardia intestinalis]KAE8302083.1 Ankyrin repeat protein 1 [Giardia intestinalis]|eukprot:XP_001708207.1 Protein 21.1 [Giardia lamblia ATCC 50803]
MTSREEWFQAIHSREYSVVATYAKGCSGMRDNYGNTGLMCAVLENDPHMVQLLASYEAGMVSATGRTALYMAVAAGHAELCYILASRERHILTEQNRTMLMVAVEMGNIDTVVVLLPYFGNERDVAGFSALDLAVLTQDTDLLQLLLDAQNPNEHDLSIALSIARDNSYTSVIQILERYARNSSAETCNNCKALAAKLAMQTELLAYLNRLVNTFYQTQSLTQRTMPNLSSVSTSVIDVPLEPYSSQQALGSHSLHTHQPPSFQSNPEQSFMPTGQPTIQYEDPTRASSSLTRPPQLNLSLNPYYQSYAPATLTQPHQHPTLTPLANRYTQFQELNANFQLLSAEYNQLKERQNARSKSFAIPSSVNHNVFSHKEKGVMGGNDDPEYGDSTAVPPATPGSTKRKSVSRASSKSNRFFGKRYMELDNTPSWPVLPDEGAETPLKTSPLRKTPSQQHRLMREEDPQTRVFPVTPMGHWHDSLSDLKEDLDSIPRLLDVPPSDGEQDSSSSIRDVKKNVSGETNLMRAAQENNLATARRFLHTEAKARLLDGTTALMIAAKFNSRELVHLLSSVEVRMQDNEGRTALHHAAEHDSLDAFQILYYQEKDLKMHSGLSIEDLAKQKNATKVLTYLLELRPNQLTHSPPRNKVETVSVLSQNSLGSKPAPKSRQIQDIINFYKAEQMANQKASSEKTQLLSQTKSNKDGGIPPSVSLSVYDAPPSPQAPRLSPGKSEPAHPIIIPAQPKQILEEAPVVTNHDTVPQSENTVATVIPTSPRKPPYKRVSSTLVLTKENATTPHHHTDPSSQNVSQALSHQPVRAGSNLKLRSVSATLKNPEDKPYSDEILSSSKRTDGLTKERVKASRRSRSNSANMKSHSPLATGKSELMICVENDEFEMGKNLIEQQHGRGDRNGCTALMYAAKLNRPNFATLLVKYEAGLVNDDDQTAYEIAMSHSNYAVAGIIRPYEKHLQKGSPERKLSLKITDRGSPSCPGPADESDSIFHGIPLSTNSSMNDETPQLTQKQHRNTTSTQDLTVEMLFTHPVQQPSARYTDTSPCTISPTDSPIMRPRGMANSTPLIEAVKMGDLPGLKRYLQEHSGFVDDLGMTALMYAAEMGNQDMVMVLRATEAKIRLAKYSLRTFYELSNGTALMIAAAKGHDSCVRALVPYEGGLADDEGHTALMIASRYAHTNMIKDLIPKEARFLDSNGQTALMIAVQNNSGKSHLEAIKLLREAELKCVDTSGVTALIWAAFAGQVEVAELLTGEAGMTTNKTHVHGAGFTALMAAAYVGSGPIVELLLPIEGKIVQANGKTVKDWAKSKNIRDMLDMIL